MQVKYAMMLASIVAGCAACNAAEPPDTASLFRANGWKAYEDAVLPPSPVREVAAVMFYDKSNTAPSCGLAVAAPRKKAAGFIEIVGSDTGANFPQFLALPSLTAFKMHNQEYIAAEYVWRDTRDETTRSYYYVRRHPEQGFVTDEALNAAAPVMDADLAAASPDAARTAQGVRLARAALFAQAHPQWRMLERDFISDKASSFAIFHDAKTRRCLFVAEAGAQPVSIGHGEFGAASACTNVLASSRLEDAGTLYYLALFKAEDNQQRLAVLSVAADGTVTAQKALADTVNRSGAPSTMKQAKDALRAALRSSAP